MDVAAGAGDPDRNRPITGFAERHRLVTAVMVGAFLILPFFYVADLQEGNANALARRDTRAQANLARLAWEEFVESDVHAVILFQAFWSNSVEVTEAEFRNFTASMIQRPGGIVSTRLVERDLTARWTWPPTPASASLFQGNDSWTPAFERAAGIAVPVITPIIPLPDGSAGYGIVVALAHPGDPQTIDGFMVATMPVERVVAAVIAPSGATGYSFVVLEGDQAVHDNGVETTPHAPVLEVPVNPRADGTISLGEPVVLRVSAGAAHWDATTGPVPSYVRVAGFLVGAITVITVWRTLGLQHERSVTRRRIQESEAHFRDLFMNAGELVILVDAENRVVVANPRALSAIGREAQEVEATSVIDLVPDSARPRVVDAFEEARIRGRVEDVAVPLRRKDGTLVDTFGTLTMTTRGSRALVLMNAVDVTRLQRLEQELRGANRNLADKVRELDSFAHTIAHDLKNPLRGIAAYADFLVEDHGPAMDPGASEYVDGIRTGAERMRMMLDALLEYARAGGERYPFTEVDVNALIHEAIEDLSPLVRERNADIRFAGLPAMEAQAIPLKQVFVNLIGNAIRHNPLPRPLVDIAAAREEHAWRFRVADNGPGVPLADRDRIFNLFQRGTSEGGDAATTGVGLAIVKRIVELHGGTIRVDDGEDHGAVFVFTIPDRSPIR